jgi:Fur family zinc uptake transcriptional regulator
MAKKEAALSPHCEKVLESLQKSDKPLSAYELLDKLRKFGIKAPPTIYRALDSLMQKGLVHRIETLNAFVACHNHEGDTGAQFAVCRDCGTTIELHDHQLIDAIKALAASLKFNIERQILELIGLCQNCSAKVPG